MERSIVPRLLRGRRHHQRSVAGARDRLSVDGSACRSHHHEGAARVQRILRRCHCGCTDAHRGAGGRTSEGPRPLRRPAACPRRGRIVRSCTHHLCRRCMVGMEGAARRDTGCHCLGETHCRIGADARSRQHLGGRRCRDSLGERKPRRSPRRGHRLCRHVVDRDHRPVRRVLGGEQRFVCAPGPSVNWLGSQTAISAASSA